MAWDDGLDGVHRLIAGSDSKRIGVLAGPGTGKTRFGLMRRVVRLLESGVHGKRILLISFTRVAAADLRDKVADLQVPGADEVRAMTLHGLCFGILQQESVLAITGRNPRILLKHEVDLMLKDIGGAFGNIYERRHLLEAFVAGWARGLDDYPGVPATEVERTFQEAVTRWLRRHDAMLIGEVVPESYRYLSRNPLAAALTSYDHVVVDEYQDLNALEQELLEVLAKAGTLCVAGDDDQSIYSVRYANPEGIVAYLRREEVESFTINVCGRCPSDILAVANSLISCAPGRAKEPLCARESESAGVVSIVQWQDLSSEVEGIVSSIAADVAAEKWEPGQILVLTNWAELGNAIRDRLVEVEIPARSFFAENALRTEQSREALAMLRLAVDESDAPSLRVMLGLGDASGRTDAYQRLLSYCDTNHLEPKAVLDRLAAGEVLELSIRALVDHYRDTTARIESMRDLDVNGLIETLIRADVPELSDLRATALDAALVADDRGQLLRAMVESITQDDVPQNPDFVRVMSLHKSKGLTAESVYIVGAVDGVLPTIPGKDAAAMAAAYAEGRRLLYVAITRAANELVISSSARAPLAAAAARKIHYDPKSFRRNDGKPTVKMIASPYLAELGADAPASTSGEQWLVVRR